MTRSHLLPFTIALAILLGGCSHGNSNSAAPSPQQARAAAQARASDRELIDEVPPPGKSRYMAIHTKASWENPFLVVSKKTVSLRVMNPEAPHSNVLPGNMLQPENARKSVLELRLADLPDALAAIPQDSWPYGRVIAVEEDPAEVRADRIQVRRNVEVTIQMLNDLGVVVYEWPGAR